MEDARTLRAKEKYEGKIFTTTDGKQQFRVNKFNSGSDIEIEFLNSGYIRHVSSYNMNKGINNPFGNSPVMFNDSEKELLGNYYRTNEGYLVQVIRVDSKKEVTIKFLDEFGYEFTTTIQNIRKGEVKNPYKKNKFGGCLGVCNYNGNEYDWLHSIWYNMLIRANDHEYYKSYHGSDTSAYDNTMVCNEWLCYSVFAEWYITETSKLNPNYSYEMDKDLKYRYYCESTNGMKAYGPNYICLMPHDLNAALRNVSNLSRYTSNYSLNELDRNENALYLADKYYKENAISAETYNLIIGTYKLK